MLTAFVVVAALANAGAAELCASHVADLSPYAQAIGVILERVW